MTESVQHQELPKTIALRPRFQKLLDHNKEVVIAAFQQEKEGDSTFVISIVDDHIFIKLPRRLQHYWSPQLHLEVNDLSENSTKMYGLFGPNPTVWTMFMFLHFVVATVFFCIWDMGLLQLVSGTELCHSALFNAYDRSDLVCSVLFWSFGPTKG
jgi:hypothetical protein